MTEFILKFDIQEVSNMKPTQVKILCHPMATGYVRQVMEIVRKHVGEAKPPKDLDSPA